MPTSIPPPTIFAQRYCASRGNGLGTRPCMSFVAIAAWFAAQILLAVTLTAQTPAKPAPGNAAAHPAPHATAHRVRRARARKRRKPVAAKPVTPSAPVATPAVPPAPKAPDWPANKQPDAAKIVWNSHGLLVEASNSSLDEILHEVSLQTGIKVEGLGADQRIFGIYGPGPSRDVLNALLDGCGYNILMIGDQGAGTPQRIVLSSPGNGAAAPAASANAAPAYNSPAEDEQEPPPPPAAQMPPPAVPLRAPQQFPNDRLHQMQQMQQQQNNGQSW